MELTFNGQIEPGYIKEVKDILENREFMQLGAFSHRQSTSRLMHSINVSYISWHIARKLGCDARMAARAGLLHDFFLYHLMRFGSKPSKILRLAEVAFDGIYDREVILEWLKVFYRRFFAQQFKRSCLPDGPKVGSVALSPRGDWRMPSDASYQIWAKELETL